MDKVIAFPGVERQSRKGLTELLARPQKLEGIEFRRLVDLYADELGIEGILEVMSRRNQGQPDAAGLERQALQAVIDGGLEDARMLTRRLRHRKRTGLTLVSDD